MRSRKSTRKLKTQVIQPKTMANAMEKRTPKRFNVYGVKVHIGSDITHIKRNSCISRKNHRNLTAVISRPSINMTPTRQPGNVLLGYLRSQKALSSPPIQTDECLQPLAPSLLPDCVIPQMDQQLERELQDNPALRQLVEDYIKRLTDSIEEVRALSNKLQQYEGSTEDEAEASEKLTKMSLKCLLQEQKINSLAYMVRQYRNGNKEAVKQLQKKILDYDPDLKNLLAFKLADTHQRLEIREKEVTELQSLLINANLPQNCSPNLLQAKYLASKNQSLLTQNRCLSEQILTLKQRLLVLQPLHQCTLNELNSTTSKLSSTQQSLSQIQQRSRQLQMQLDQARHKITELSYQVNIKQQLQKKLQQKKKIIAEQQSQISKLTSQSNMYRTRLDMIAQDFYKKIIQEKYLIENLNHLNAEAYQTKTKMAEELESLHPDITHELLKEKITFMRHMFNKNQDLLAGIIGELKIQMATLHSEAQHCRKALEELKQLNHRLTEQRNRTYSQIRLAQQRFTKYLHEMSRINVKSCISCNEFLGYCHQIDRIFGEFMETLPGFAQT